MLVQNKIKYTILSLAALALPFFVSAQASLGIEAASGTGLGTADLKTIIGRVIQILLGFLGLVAVILLIYGGYLYLTSQGEEDQTRKAKQLISGAVVGLVIILSAYAIAAYVIKIMNPVTGDSGPGSDATLPNSCIGANCISGEVFRPVTVQPKGKLNIRNVQVRITFNSSVNPQSLISNPQSLSILQRNPGSGSWHQYAGVFKVDPNNSRVVLFTPNSNCPAPHQDLKCFDYSETESAVNSYRVYIRGLNGAFSTVIYDMSGRKLTCTLGSPCNTLFTVGKLVDTENPKGNFIDAKNIIHQPYFNVSLNDGAGLAIDDQYIISANISDDGGVAGVEFYEDKNSQPMFFGEDAPTGEDSPLSFLANSNGQSNPGTWSSESSTGKVILESYYLNAKVIDIAGHEAWLNKVRVITRPVHCLNQKFDGQGSPAIGAAPDVPETGADCGGLCGACSGQSCNDKIQVSCVPNQSLCANSFCNTSSCLCQATPQIYSVDLNNGASGNWVTILGRGFGSTKLANSSIKFIDNAGQEVEVSPVTKSGCANSWNDSYIIVEVPNTVQGLGKIKVIANGLPSNYSDFTVNNIKRPGLCTISPSKGGVKTDILVRGNQFNGTTSENKDLYFGQVGSGISANDITFLSNDGVAGKVPNLSLGQTVARVRVTGQDSNALPFTVNEGLDDTMEITSLEPNFGPPGQYITISGVGFGASKGTSSVFFPGNVEADYSFPASCSTNYWSNNQVVVKVPEGTSAGLIELVRSDGKKAKAKPAQTFIYGDPAIYKPTAGLCSINPGTGAVAENFEVAGDNFSGGDKLFFTNVTTGIASENNNIYRGQVPSLAKTGKVQARPDLNSVQGLNSSCSNSSPCIDPHTYCNYQASPAKCELRQSNSLNFKLKEGSANNNPVVNASYYQWQFTTCANCLAPYVVESNSCSASQVASPSPKRDSQGNFTDASVAITFNQFLDINSFVQGQAYVLEKCGTGASANNCQLDNSINFTLDNGGVVVTNFNDQFTAVLKHVILFEPNTWYRFVLKKGIKSYQDKIPMNQEYSWYFKTKDSNQACEPTNAVCLPGNSIIRKEQTISNTAQSYNQSSCNICSQDLKWNWSALSSAVEVVPVGTTSKATTKGKSLSSNTGAQASVDMAGTTVQPGICRMAVVEPNPRVVIDQQCSANSQSPSPFPNSTKNCMNAALSLRFDLPMNFDLNNLGVTVFNLTSDSEVKLPTPIVVNNNFNQPIGLVFKLSSWSSNSQYQVSLDPVKLVATNGSGLAYDSLLSWVFETGSNTCNFEKVLVSPEQANIPLNESREYRAWPIGPQCQLLNLPELSWTWRSEDSSLASVLPDVSQANREKATVTGKSVGQTKIRAKASASNIENLGDNGLVNITSDAQSTTDLKVTQVKPVNGSTGVCLNAGSEVDFNTSLNANTITNQSFEIYKWGATPTKIDSSIMVSNFNKTVYILPNTNLEANTDYEATITSDVRNSYGQALDRKGCEALGKAEWQYGSRCIWKFRTGSNLCQPDKIVIDPISATSTIGAISNWQGVVIDKAGLILNDKPDWKVVNNQFTQAQTLVASAQEPILGTNILNVKSLALGEADIQAKVGSISKEALLSVVETPKGPNIYKYFPTREQNVCRNSLVSINFSQPINPDTFKDRVVIKYSTLNKKECDGSNSNQTNSSQFHVATDQNWFDNILTSLVNRFLSPEFEGLYSQVSQILVQKVFAHGNYWCDYKLGKWELGNEAGRSVARLVIDQLLPANEDMKVIVKSGSAGVIGINGLPLDLTNVTVNHLENGNFVYQFKTGQDKCEVAKVNVIADTTTNNPEWIFNTSKNDPSDDYFPLNGTSYNCQTNQCDMVKDADKVYAAIGLSQDDQAINPIKGVYEWMWSWSSSNLSVAQLASSTRADVSDQIVLAQNKSGTADIIVNAIFPPTYNQTNLSGQGKAVVDLCSSQWPAQDQIYPDVDFDFSLKYCRDNSEGGDLPAIETSPVRTDYNNQKIGQDDLLRQYLFKVPDTSGDVIGLRVYENNYYQNPTQWYVFSSSTSKGLPQNLAEKIDGYQAATDGRSTYISFTKQMGSNLAKPFELVVSFNQDASPKTIEIAKRLVKGLKFNVQINPNDRSVIARDFIRLSDLQYIAYNIDQYNVVKNSYPSLASGSYLNGISTSKWPSWDKTLAKDLNVALPKDPINDFGSCAGCNFDITSIDPGFEKANTWHKVYNSSVPNGGRECNGFAPEGSCFWSITPTGSGGVEGVASNQGYLFGANTTYQVSVLVYNADETNNANLSLDVGNNNIANKSVAPKTWTKIEANYSSGNAAVSLPIQISTTDDYKFLVDKVEINMLAGYCKDFDPETCWNPSGNNGAGVFACSQDSYFYKYNLAKGNTSSPYNLTAKAELITSWADDRGSNKNINPHIIITQANQAINGCTTGIVSGSCGDGQVSSPEQCEPGMNYSVCGYGHNWYSQKFKYCDLTGVNACKWQVNAPACISSLASCPTNLNDPAQLKKICGGYCGDGVRNTKGDGYDVLIDEECDASAGEVGFGGGSSQTDQYACSNSCHDIGGWFGDNIVQGQYGEQCDGQASLQGWSCLGSSNAPYCGTDRKIHCNSGTPYRGQCGNNIVENSEQCDICGASASSQAPGQGECLGTSATKQYFCSNQCTWTGGWCGDGIVQDVAHPVQGKSLEYCDISAPEPDHVLSCNTGCQSFSCEAGYHDCDAKATNGCEVNGSNDVNHCGGCPGSGGVVCGQVPHSAPSCQVGQCKLTCEAGFYDADGDYSNGCEGYCGDNICQSDYESYSGATSPKFKYACPKDETHFKDCQPLNGWSFVGGQLENAVTGAPLSGFRLTLVHSGLLVKEEVSATTGAFGGGIGGQGWSVPTAKENETVPRMYTLTITPPSGYEVPTVDHPGFKATSTTIALGYNDSTWYKTIKLPPVYKVTGLIQTNSLLNLSSYDVPLESERIGAFASGIFAGASSPSNSSGNYTIGTAEFISSPGSLKPSSTFLNTSYPGCGFNNLLLGNNGVVSQDLFCPYVSGYFCGDGIAYGNEECDTTDLRGKSCQILNNGTNTWKGSLVCNSSCQLDYKFCFSAPTGNWLKGGTGSPTGDWKVADLNDLTVGNKCAIKVYVNQGSSLPSSCVDTNQKSYGQLSSGANSATMTYNESNASIYSYINRDAAPNKTNSYYWMKGTIGADSSQKYCIIKNSSTSDWCGTSGSTNINKCTWSGDNYGTDFCWVCNGAQSTCN